MLFLRKTDETIWNPPSPFSKRTPLSTNPLFLSNFFMTPPLCPNFKNENPSPPLPHNFRGGRKLWQGMGIASFTCDNSFHLIDFFSLMIFSKLWYNNSKCALFLFIIRNARGRQWTKCYIKVALCISLLRQIYLELSIRCPIS